MKTAFIIVVVCVLLIGGFINMEKKNALCRRTPGCDQSIANVIPWCDEVPAGVRCSVRDYPWEYTPIPESGKY